MERSSVFTQVVLTIIAMVGVLFAGVLPTAAQVTTPNVCADPAYTTRFAPMYRQWNLSHIDHFYTNSSTETAPGYIAEQPVGNLINNQEFNTVPLYRYYSSSLTDHFYSTSDQTPAGYVSEGVIGYIFPAQQQGTVPLYRLYRHQGQPLNGDHLYTSSLAERDSASQHGYVYESIEGYVCPM